MRMTKSRFCPSPTGYLHLGNTRTALFNALLAKHTSGQFLLRIEDTDKSRSFEHYTQALLDNLQWLGLNWQEGPGIEGPAAPYSQSQRQSIYHHYYEQLIQRKLAYPCFCSDSELAIMRKVQLASGRPPRYAGGCHALTAQEIAQKEAKGLLPTLRFAVPQNQTLAFTDLVRGPQRFNSNDIGDFIIRRADGTASFIFCNALDDALMGVTHALRGEDHLSNTPRQLLLLEALGLPAPQYGHLALIVGNDRAPLSKRHGSRSVVELREEGFLPGAIVNYLARLGHSYTQTGYLSLDELAQYFSTKMLGSAPSRFDPEQLLYWQKAAVLKLSPTQAWEWLGDAIKQQILPEHHALFMEVVKPNLSFPKDALTWIDILYGSNALDYPPEHREILIKAGSAFFEKALALLPETGLDFKALSGQLAQVLQIKGKALYEPLRLALTNQSHGPEMMGLFNLLGLEKVKKRFEYVLEMLSGRGER
jgi:glutamyl-tRNA synthetase